ncbi:hypothetical protein EUZ85_16555 [Hahella sp. KA22]|nr:hypothetical protein ENC22_13990 [Hahella sp. KA22]QAY55619.1 hypothetical protein EUZ85_16555 [Hahella sp. KA22]
MQALSLQTNRRKLFVCRINNTSLTPWKAPYLSACITLHKHSGNFIRGKGFPFASRPKRLVVNANTTAISHRLINEGVVGSSSSVIFQPYMLGTNLTVSKSPT